MVNEKIGEINGKWAVLFKIHLGFVSVLSPFVLGWFIWATVNLFNHQARLDALPPTAWREKIHDLETNQALILQSLDRIDKYLEQTEKQ